MNQQRLRPSEISQTYRIASAKNRTSVTGGATVDLDAPSAIDINGAEMRESKPFSLKGTDYRYGSDQFEPSFQLAFHAADGKIYRHEINNAALEIAAENIILHRSRKMEIRLSRRVAKNETVRFSLRLTDARVISSNSNDDRTNSNAAPEIYVVDDQAEMDSSREFLTIEPAQTKNFASGRASLTIEVSKSSDLQQSPGKGGSIYFAYESQTATIRVVNQR